MKSIYKICVGLLVFSLAVFSCSKDVNLTGQGEEVTILISTGEPQTQTRAPEGEEVLPADPDEKIGTLRVLVYHESNGLLYIKSDMFTPPDNPEEIILRTGRYHFVFIANEELDPDLHDELEGLDEGIHHITELSEIRIDQSAFNSKIMGGTVVPDEEDTLIPKVVMKDNVLVSKRDGQIMIIESDGTTTNNSTHNWVVGIIQAGIRIDMSFEMTTDQLALYNANNLVIGLENIPDHVKLLGYYNYTSGETINRTLNNVETSGSTTVSLERIILPETFFADSTKMENGIKLTARYGGETYSTYLDINSSTGSECYRIKRGTWLIINGITISNNQINFGAVTVCGWDGAHDAGIIELE